MKKLLKSFTAGFAKWRYETVVQVLGQLGRLRQICEQELVANLRTLFSQVADLEELAGVQEACQNVPFWRWVIVSQTEIFLRIEKLRKWGMVCDHPEHEQKRKDSNYKISIDCPRMRNRSGSSSSTEDILSKIVI